MEHRRDPAKTGGPPRPVKRSRSGLVLILLVALASALAAFVVSGVDALAAGGREGAASLLAVAPRVVLAVLLAGFVQVLLPRETIARWLGAGSGLKGIVAASFAGALTIGGPMTSFPIVAALAAAGADFGAIVAFLSAWSLIGVQRMVVWELAFLGAEFTLLRALSCLALPIIAGLLARALQRRLDPPRPTEGSG